MYLTRNNALKCVYLQRRINRYEIIIFSGLNFDLHSRVKHIFVIMRLSVMTKNALALLSAFKPSAKALTIIFSALGLFACTFSWWKKRRNSFKSTWITIISHLLCFIYFMLAWLMIMTIYALTIFVTHHPFCKTLAVHFQTIYLTTLASLLIPLSRGQIISLHSA